MSAHPHPGKRSEWRLLWRKPPQHSGNYEWRCSNQKALTVREIKVLMHCAYLATGNVLYSGCPQCQWRGLAEKPE